MRRLTGSIACFVLSVALAECRVDLQFGEPSSETFFKNVQQSHGTLTEADLVSTATALLNLAALSRVDAGTSAKVAQIVSPDPFHKPAALATFVLGGLHEEAMDSFSGTKGTAEAAGKDLVLAALNSLSQAPSLEHTPLDISNLPGCGNACLEAALKEAVVGLGLDANYTQGIASLQGDILIRVSEAPQLVVFHLQSVADRLFAIELASTWKAVSDAVQERQRREQQDPESYQKPQLIERVLVSAQTIQNAYGKDSGQYKVACCLIRQLVTDSISRLSQAYSNRLASIVATLDSSELAGGTSEIVQLLGWSSRAQRPTRSLLAVGQASQEDEYIQRYVAWIVMWGTFFLLLFFAISGCHCLKGMKFKQDSLLYGKNKTE